MHHVLQLRCRLERMERRMQQLRHNTSRGEHSIASPLSPAIDAKRTPQNRGIKR
jgi:hypothetical protein